MTALATALPENSNDGYVAAAYIVFFALVLVYVAIMAIRLSRVERSVRELSKNARDGDLARADTDLARPDEDPAEETLGRPRPEGTERERTLTGTPHGGGQAGETV